MAAGELGGWGGQNDSWHDCEDTPYKIWELFSNELGILL